MPPESGEFNQSLISPQGGLNLRDASHVIRDDQFLILENIDPVQSRGGFKVREGVSKLNATPYRGTGESKAGLYRAVEVGDNLVSFFIAANEDTGSRLYEINAAGATAQVGSRTFTTGADWFYAQLRNKLFAVNGIDPLVRIDEGGSGLVERDAGYPAPSSEPTTATGAAGALTGTFLYAVSFVYDSDPNHESSAFDTVLSTNTTSVSPIAQEVDLTVIPTGPAGCTARNLYRTADGGAKLFFLDTIDDNTTVIYTDNAADDTILDNELAPNDNGLPPVDGQFIISFQDRLWIAKDDVVSFSARFASESAPTAEELTASNSIHGGDPEIFPVDFSLVIGAGDGDRITGMAVYQNHPVIFKNRSIYFILGDNSQNYRVFKVHSGQGAASQRSIDVVENRLFFLSGGARPGIYSYDGSFPSPLSINIEPILTDEFEFAKFSLAHGLRYRHLYVLAFRSNTASAPADSCDNWLVYDYTQNAWYKWITKKSFSMVTADDLDGKLYFLGENSTLYKYGGVDDDDGTPITARIKTKYFDWGVGESEKEIREVFLPTDKPSTAFDLYLYTHADFEDATSFSTLPLPTSGNPVHRGLVRASHSSPQDVAHQGNYISFEIGNREPLPVVSTVGMLPGGGLLIPSSSPIVILPGFGVTTTGLFMVSYQAGTNLRFNIREIVINGFIKAPRQETQA